MTETNRITASNVNVFYGAKQAIDDVSIDIPNDYVTAFIGPSGCGKSTFLRALNRMNDTIPGCRVEGAIKLDGEDIYGPEMDVVQLRARVGMVFQKPNPFPKSIYENVAYGPRIHGLANGKAEMDALLSDINQAGLGRSLQFELFRPGNVAVKEYYAELPIEIRVTGRYHDMGAFASDIANLSRIVTLNNLSVTPVAGREGNLSMSATAKTFRYLDSEEVSAQRKAVAPKAGAKK